MDGGNISGELASRIQSAVERRRPLAGTDAGPDGVTASARRSPTCACTPTARCRARWPPTRSRPAPTSTSRPGGTPGVERRRAPAGPRADPRRPAGRRRRPPRVRQRLRPRDRMPRLRQRRATTSTSGRRSARLATTSSRGRSPRRSRPPTPATRCAATARGSTCSSATSTRSRWPRSARRRRTSRSVGRTPPGVRRQGQQRAPTSWSTRRTSSTSSSRRSTGSSASRQPRRWSTRSPASSRPRTR